MRKILTILLLLAVVPILIGWQGGNAVFNSLRLGTPLAREFMEPQGLQDSASEILTSNFSTMSSTYQTVLSGEVTTGEDGDAVHIHVQGQIGRMGPVLYVLDGAGSELWEVGEPANPDLAINQGSFGTGLASPSGVTSHSGALYILNSSDRMLYRLDDPTTPNSLTPEGILPSGAGTPRGIASHGGNLYVVATTQRRIYEVTDPSTPSGATNQGSLPSGLTQPGGITSHNGNLYVVDSNDGELWEVTDPSSPSGATDQGDLPFTTPTGITSFGGSLYVTEATSLWRLDDPSTPGGAVEEGTFASTLTSATGITAIGNAPCMIRVARGTTEIDSFDLGVGRILFDTTFTDAPATAGTYTYSLQMRTQDPNTLCTAYVQNSEGTIPIPSILVQSFYEGDTP